MSTSLPPEPELAWGKTLRTLSFWAILIVGTIAFVQFASKRRSNSVEITYNQFVTELAKQNLRSVEITGPRRVHGQFKTPVTIGTQASDQFAITLPFETNDAWVATLLEKGVEVRGAEEQQSLGLALLAFLPYLLILFLVLFMLRQLKARRLGN